MVIATAVATEAAISAPLSRKMRVPSEPPASLAIGVLPFSTIRPAELVEMGLIERQRGIETDARGPFRRDRDRDAPGAGPFVPHHERAAPGRQPFEAEPSLLV